MSIKILTLALALLSCWNGCTGESLQPQRYIVYMGAAGDSTPEMLVASHQHILANVFQSKTKAIESLVYSYKYGFNGFSAWITKAQADKISKMQGIVSVFPSRTLSIHTTRSWDFLGQPTQSSPIRSLPEKAATNDVIIGILDTGLWPEAASFDDSGFGPVPARWKGECNNTAVKNKTEIFKCTKKIVGGRFYPVAGFPLSNTTRKLNPFSNKLLPSVQEYTNARDGNGHGTHTSSTAIGRSVVGANLVGLGKGIARGGFSSGRIGMYKVCGDEGSCSEDGVLAGFDDAINDGVDVLSLSLGGDAENYDLDGIAIGSFHAVEKGIVVSCSAGNGGPYDSFITNTAPWIITVGASTLDRLIAAVVTLGDGTVIQGSGLNLDKGKEYKLVYGGDIPSNGSSAEKASRCESGSLDAKRVKGNIILCNSNSAGDYGVAEDELVQEGATGLIAINDYNADLLFDFPLQGTFVKTIDGAKILSYLKKTKDSKASISESKTILNIKPAPVVAGFSSRGPNTISPDIIKPDVTAPGVNILAAWSESSPIQIGNKTILTKYNIISGTSMSCPHVAGAVSYLKSLHPQWTPAAIRSALMTTASHLDNTNAKIKDYNGKEATPFQSGAGEINPTKATDPGLVYDTTTADYISYLCATGYDSSKLKIITGNNSLTCPKKSTAPQLNYPSIGFANVTGTQSLERVVTNVGSAVATYTVEVNSPAGIVVKVTPSKLSFTAVGQKLSYTVTVTSKISGFGSLTWSDGKHQVRSPIAVTIASSKH